MCVDVGGRAFFVENETASVQMSAATNWEAITIVSTEGDGEWHSPHWTVGMYAAERKEAIIVLGNSFDEDILVTLTVSPESHDDGNLVFGFNNPELLVPAQGEASFIFYVEANQSVTPGTYSTTVNIDR